MNWTQNISLKIIPWKISLEKQQMHWPSVHTTHTSTGHSCLQRYMRNMHLTFEKAVFAVDHIDSPPLQASGAVKLAVVLIKTSIRATHGHKRRVAAFLAHTLGTARYFPDHTLPTPATVRPPARTLICREKRLNVKNNINLCVIHQPVKQRHQSLFAFINLSYNVLQSCHQNLEE